MAYSPDAVRAKLTTLNETQDSIVANAQWLLFHRRHADRTAQLWLERLTSPQLSANPAKRLNLIYLANEVVQQSRARGKNDFLLAFEPIIAEATSAAYKGANENVQGKIRRVVEVWRQRGVFEKGILDVVEARLAEVDKAKGGNRSGGKLGGSLFGGSGANGTVPAELDALAKSQVALSRADSTKNPAVDNADKEYSKLTDPTAVVPSPPVHAARLSALTKSLATAQGAVEASIRARKELLDCLENLIRENKSKLELDESTLELLSTRRDGIEVKKREVEDNIMRGLSNSSSPEIVTPTQPGEHVVGDHNIGDPTAGDAPAAESLTPPPPEIESFTPELAGREGTAIDAVPLPIASTSVPDSFPRYGYPTGAQSISELPPSHDEPPPSFPPPTVLEPEGYNVPSEFAAPQYDRVRQASSEIPAAATNGNPGDPRLKRRKMNHTARPSDDGDGADPDIFGPNAGMVGVDEEGVAALLA